MINRSFLTDNGLFWLAVFFIASPFAAMVPLLAQGYWWIVFVACLVSYFIFVCFERVIRIITFENGRIKVTPSLSLLQPTQKRVNVAIEEIVLADFCFIQGNSEGDYIHHAWEVPCLVLTLKDGAVKRLVLWGFKHDTIKEIEETLKLCAPNLAFKHESDSLIINKKR